MTDQPSIIDANGKIAQKGDITDKSGTPRPGRVEMVEGQRYLLSDGTVAGPMHNSDLVPGDVFKWHGIRRTTENVILGQVWLDSQGNAHSDPSPLDAVSVYTGQ